MKTKQKDFGMPGAGQLWVYFLLIGFSLSGERLRLANSEETSEEQEKQEESI